MTYKIELPDGSTADLEPVMLRWEDFDGFRRGDAIVLELMLGETAFVRNGVLYVIDHLAMHRR